MCLCTGACSKKAKKAYMLTPSFHPVKILSEIKAAIGKASVQELALGFHMLICDLICIQAEKYKKLYSVNQIALSGGVFNNRIITASTILTLEEKGFSVYINEKVPCGDGGIALGQAYIAGLED